MQPTNDYYEKMKKLRTAIITAGLTAIVLIVLFCLAWPSPVQAVAKPSAMPTQLDLGGVLFKIDVIDAPGGSTGFIGYTRCEIHHIELRKDSGDLREVLQHEILHGYVCEGVDKDFTVENMYYNSKTEDGHEGFDRTATVVVDALERNPGLAAYLAGASK